MRTTGPVALVIAVAMLTLPIGGCTEASRTGIHSTAPPSERSGGHLPVPDEAPATPGPSVSASATSPVGEPDGTSSPGTSTGTSVAQSEESLERAAPSQSLDDGVCSTAEGARWVAEKDHYSPPDNVYPAILQGNDLGPIEAIQTLYAQAQASGAAKFGELEVEEHGQVKSGVSEIRVTGQRGPVKVALSDEGIRIGHRLFSDPKTTSLFQVLRRLLDDLGSHCKYQGLRGSRLRTRGYKDFVRIELNYGAIVVHLEAASNGPANPERLYVLDVLESKNSFLWGHEHDASVQ